MLDGSAHIHHESRHQRQLNNHSLLGWINNSAILYALRASAFVGRSPFVYFVCFVVNFSPPQKRHIVPQTAPDNTADTPA